MNGRIGGEWRLMVFENTISGIEHVALIKGDISTPDPVLVRMHSLNMMTDLLGEVSERRSGNELEAAMQTIADAGRGIVVLLRESSKASLSETISAAMSGASAQDAGQGLREYGVGAQILVELGVSRMVLLSNRPSNVVSLDGYDLEIVDWRHLNGDPAQQAE
jgi:3,4-dihydroxy 2-butanone 4-phosphate synthase/GTP cyclohydrolase II